MNICYILIVSFSLSLCVCVCIFIYFFFQKEYYQSDRPSYPAHYRHSQSDLTVWDEHQSQQQQHSNHNPYGSTAALHNMGARRSAGPERTEPVDRYAYRNGRENGADWDDERPRPR